jgi:hypothetical protein
MNGIWVQALPGPMHLGNTCKTDTSKDIGKGKAIPLQAWTGPEGSKRLRLPDFITIGT